MKIQNMMKLRFCAAATAALAGLLLLAACVNPAAPATDALQTLTIQLQPIERSLTIFPSSINTAELQYQAVASRAGFTDISSGWQTGISSLSLEALALGEWNISVEARDASPTVLYSASTSVTIEAGTNSIALTLVPLSDGEGSVAISLSWNTEAGADSYVLSWERLESNNSFSPVDLTASITPVFNAALASLELNSTIFPAGAYIASLALKKDTTVLRTLRFALNVWNNRNSSAEIAIANLAAAPSAPSGLQIITNRGTNNAITNFSLTWTGTSAIADGYNVYRKLNAGEEELADPLLWNQNTWTDTTIDYAALGAGDTISYRVAAYNNIGETSSNPVTTSAIFSVSYDANGATSGTAPSSQKGYVDNSIVIQAPDLGMLRTGYTFAGWENAGSTYQAGTTIILSSVDMVLEAVWHNSLINIIIPDRYNPDIVFTPSTIDLASWDSLSLDAPAGYNSWAWYINNQPMSNESSFVFNALYNPPGLYTIRLVVDGLYSGSVQIQVRNDMGPPPALFIQTATAGTLVGNTQIWTYYNESVLGSNESLIQPNSETQYYSISLSGAPTNFKRIHFMDMGNLPTATITLCAYLGTELTNTETFNGDIPLTAEGLLYTFENENFTSADMISIEAKQQDGSSITPLCIAGLETNYGYINFRDTGLMAGLGTDTVTVSNYGPVRDILLYSAEANGNPGTVRSTELTLRFSEDPGVFRPSMLQLNGAAMGTVSGSGTERSIQLLDLYVDNLETIELTLTDPMGAAILPKTHTITVYDDTSHRYSQNLGTLLRVPAGTYNRDSTPENISTLSSFYMAQYEVTNDQFTMIMSQSPSNPTYGVDSYQPVQNLNWYQAITFCNKLSIAEGLEQVYSVSDEYGQIDFAILPFYEIPTTDDSDWNSVDVNGDANGYRLPTYSEWLWAAMGANQDSQGSAMMDGINVSGYNKPFAGYDGETSIDSYVWHSGNSQNQTRFIGPTNNGTQLPNELGLYDMSGNVSEWLWDWDWTLTPLSGHFFNYKGPETGTEKLYSGWSFNDEFSESTLIDHTNVIGPQGTQYSTGLRVVRK